MKTPRQINAERKKEGRPPLNFRLLRRVLRRIETKPETYAQQVWEEDAANFNENARDRYSGGKPRPIPACGTVACIAGETIICDAPSIKVGLQKLRVINSPSSRAAALLGLDFEERGNLFDGDAELWMDPFRTQFENAKTYRGQARAAINYLKHIIATGRVTE